MSIRGYIAIGIAILFVILIGVVLWLRADLIKAEADAKQWKANAETFQRANETNKTTIETYKTAREQNDKLTEALTVEIARLNSRGVQIRTEIKEAIRNDPQAADWANSAVPDSLRNAASRR